MFADYCFLHIVQVCVPVTRTSCAPVPSQACAEIELEVCRDEPEVRHETYTEPGPVKG